jgi:hypothetical protein
MVEKFLWTKKAKTNNDICFWKTNLVCTSSSVLTVVIVLIPNDFIFALHRLSFLSLLSFLQVISFFSTFLLFFPFSLHYFLSPLVFTLVMCRCKLAALYRLVDLHGWTQGIYNHITVSSTNLLYHST